jgi:hypothetical protein
MCAPANTWRRACATGHGVRVRGFAFSPPRARWVMLGSMKHAESFGLFSSVKALRELLQTKLATGEAEAAREELQTSLEEIDVLWEELRAQAEDLARERQRYAEFFEYAPDAYLKSDGAGSAIVQDPGEAMHPSMPLNALQNVEVDYKARLSEIGKLLGKLRPREAPHAPDLPMEEKRKLEAEVRIAEQDSGMMHDILGKGELSPFTCPECHGVLARMHEASCASAATPGMRSPPTRCLSF